MAPEMKLPETPALTSPLARLKAIGELAHFARVHEAIGEQLFESEHLSMEQREANFMKADEHFETFEKAVGQLVEMICGDGAVAQLNMVEAHCAELEG